MKCRATAAAAAATLFALPAAAQVTPPAQVLQNNPTVNPDRINEEQRRRLEARAAPEASPPSETQVEAPPAAEATAGEAAAVSFTLNAITFDPSNYFAPAELDALAAPLIGREVSLGDLQKLVDAINILYASRGLTTARAALAAQQIDGGTVRITLVEGRVGATSVEGGSARTRAYAARRAAPAAGSLATPADLEQRLRLFNLNNDAQLRARLAPGSAYGTTDVVLTAAEPARISGDVFFDNNGFESTGTAEIGAVLRLYRLFGDSDRLSAVIVASRGVLSTSLSLSTPVGDRFRIGASGSYGRTHVVYGAIAGLGVRGTSISFGGDAAALLSYSDTTTLSATAAVQTSLSRTSVGGQRVIENEAVSGTLGFNASYAIPGLAATLQSQLTLSNVRERLSGAQVTPLIFQGSGVVAKAIVARVQARVRADWQLATEKNLPGILQYQIGGTRSARAFAPGIAAGDAGVAISAELAYGAAWKGIVIEPFAFVEAARVSVPGQTVTANAAGAGLNLSFAPSLNIRGTLATDIGHSQVLRGSTRAYISATAHF